MNVPTTFGHKRGREEFEMMESGRAFKDLGPSVGAPVEAWVQLTEASVTALVRSPAVQPKPLLQ